MATEMSGLSLLKGKALELTPDLKIRHTLLKEIEENGERYFDLLGTLISTSIDVADVLWFESGIWYEDIKSEWDFFLEKATTSRRSGIVKVLGEEGKLLNIQADCLFLNTAYAESLNYFLETDGEWILSERKTGEHTQKILYNVKVDNQLSDGFIVTNLLPDALKFTQYFYELTNSFLRKTHWILSNYDFLKGGTKFAKRYILKEDYRKRRKKHKPTITLDSVVSSLIAKGVSYEEIWDFPIYLVYDVYYRMVKIDEYENTMLALYNGCIDTKKNPVNWDKINWASVIKTE